MLPDIKHLLAELCVIAAEIYMTTLLIKHVSWGTCLIVSSLTKAVFRLNSRKLVPDIFWSLVFTYEERSRRFSESDISITTGTSSECCRACMRQDRTFKFRCRNHVRLFTARWHRRVINNSISFSCWSLTRAHSDIIQCPQHPVFSGAAFWMKLIASETRIVLRESTPPPRLTPSLPCLGKWQESRGCPTIWIRMFLGPCHP